MSPGPPDRGPFAVTRLGSPRLLGGLPCFWMPANDDAGPVMAFVSCGRDALEEALEELLEGMDDLPVRVPLQ